MQEQMLIDEIEELRQKVYISTNFVFFLFFTDLLRVDTLSYIYKVVLYCLSWFHDRVTLLTKKTWNYMRR